MIFKVCHFSQNVPIFSAPIAFSFPYVLINLADVIPVVADGLTTVVRVVYFNLTSWVLNRTLSHKCGRWDLHNILVEGWIIDYYVY